MVSPVQEVLSEANYEYWKACLECYFKEKGLWEVVGPQSSDDKGDDWEQRNALALHAIRMSCGLSNYQLIRKIDVASQAWLRLTSLQELRVHVENDVVDESSSFVPGHEQLMKAVSKGDLAAVEAYLCQHPEAKTAGIAANGDTALHVAIRAGHIKLAKWLVGQGLRLSHRTLALAAMNGHVPLAKAIVDTGNQQLVGTKKYAVIYAAQYGHADMVRYLYPGTPRESLGDSNDPEVGPRLLTCLISNEIYDVALELLKLNPALGIAPDGDGNYGFGLLAKKPSSFKSSVQQYSLRKRLIYHSVHLTNREMDAGDQVRVTRIGAVDVENGGHDQAQREVSSSHTVHSSDVLGQSNSGGVVWKLVPACVRSVYNRKLIHGRALELLRIMFTALSSEDDLEMKLEKMEIYEVMKDAITNGITEFIEGIIKIVPDIVEMEDKINGRSLFAVAMVERQGKIFSFIIDNIDASRAQMLASDYDIFKNNFLHLAAKQSPPYRHDKPSGPALQMQCELQWFKEVEKLVQPKHKEEKNNNNKTPGILFTDEHEKMMKEAESWMKNIAASCMVVATLIAALMFTTIFTPPGGNHDDTGIPVFLGQDAFAVFIFSNALSLFSSSTSMLMFLGILTARFAERDYLKVLPYRLGMGLLTLFFSVVTMMVAFGSTVFISLHHHLDRVSIPINVIAVFPIAIFVSLEFPLVFKIFYRTYHGGPFKYPSKSIRNRSSTPR